MENKKTKKSLLKLLEFSKFKKGMKEISRKIETVPA